MLFHFKFNNVSISICVIITFIHSKCGLKHKLIFGYKYTHKSMCFKTLKNYYYYNYDIIIYYRKNIVPLWSTNVLLNFKFYLKVNHKFT